VTDRFINARCNYDQQVFRVWPDGTVQDIDDGDPYLWMSDDYVLVFAETPDEALDTSVNKP